MNIENECLNVGVLENRKIILGKGKGKNGVRGKIKKMKIQLKKEKVNLLNKENANWE